LSNRMSLETSVKIPQGTSPVTGQRYFPASFNCIQHIHQLSRTTDKNVGKFNRPRKVGHFSVDGERKFRDDDSQLRYFAPPVNRFGQPMKKPNFNLSMGMDDPNNVYKDEKLFEGLDNLLKWCVAHWDQVCGEGLTQPNVMTWRGVLTKIMNCPYDNNTKWNICAIKYKGTIYLAEYKTDEQHAQQEQLPKWIKRTMYWGRKVENYLTSPKPGQPSTPKEPINENAEYVSVFRSQLGKIQLLYGAEVDCIDHTMAEEYKPPANFIEIKTQSELRDKNRKSNFRKYKLSKWWAQSYLAGIPRVMTAFRDDRGFVNLLEVIETQAMPRVAAQESYSWTPQTMMGFLERFLTFIRDVMAKVDDVTYVFEWDPDWEGIVFTFDPDQTKEHYFIPQWFKDHINNAAVLAQERKAKLEQERVETALKVAQTPQGEAICLD